jgi:hypothetical protein
VTFALVGLLAAVVTLPFALAFLLAPAAVSLQYGIADFNPGTLVVARLFGCMLLFAGGAGLAARHTTDVLLQSRMASWFAAGSLLATLVSVHAAVTGATTSLGWLTVALYGFFTAAWASVAARRTR